MEENKKKEQERKRMPALDALLPSEAEEPEGDLEGLEEASDFEADEKEKEMMERRAKGLKGWRKKRGLPPKSGTKVSLAACLRALREHKGAEVRAAKSLKITYNTWQNYKRKWPELEELAQEYELLKVEKVKETAYRRATDKEDPSERLIQYILDKKGKPFGFEKEFKDDRPQVTVNIGTQVAIQLTDELKDSLVDSIKRKRLAAHEVKQLDYGLKELEKQEEEKHESEGPSEAILD